MTGAIQKGKSKGGDGTEPGTRGGGARYVFTLYIDIDTYKLLNYPGTGPPTW